MLTGKWLITGGAGFIGRGILRRASQENWPCDFTCFSRDETKQALLKRRYPHVRCVLGDIRDGDRLATVMAGHDGVIHAAALKYVPEAEQNVLECVDINILGSINVAQAAVKAEVQTVIGMSTDKSCLPVNTYGMTKALLERIFGEADAWSDTNFTTVRYGNVVGSTGSVIPLFQWQAKEHKEITVTDERMTRFWLSADDAIELILHASRLAATGTTLIHRCGAMKIIDLARMIAGGLPVRITGLRPGEKLDETLIHYQESMRTERLDGPYEILWPTIDETPTEGQPWSYVSHTPDHWITEDEMAAMIADSMEI